MLSTGAVITAVSIKDKLINITRSTRLLSIILYFPVKSSKKAMAAMLICA
jgi:hypothetical protein